MPAQIPTDERERTEASDEAIDAFIERWRAAQAAEIANGQSFVIELCSLLGVEGPPPRDEGPGP